MDKAVFAKGTLLIIDDIPDNVKILLSFLVNEGFKVLVAKDGEQGLRVANYAHPDLILLDIMMPGIDGFEVCKQLKAKDSTKDIPVIFMSALSDTVDKVKGFDAGAADYIAKPVQQEEVLARINAHLKLRQLQRQLEEQNQQLLHEIDLRRAVEGSLNHINMVLAQRTIELQAQTAQLEQRNSELDAFSYTVAHDLKNPLNGIIGITELLKVSGAQTPNLPPHWSKQIHLLEMAGDQMANIIEAILLLSGISRQQEIPLQSLNMAKIVEEVLQQQTMLIEQYHGKIILSPGWPSAKGYAPWIKEVWVNYLSNGLKYGGSPPFLEFGADSPAGGMVRFWVRDNGAGLSAEAITQLFTPFTRLQKRIEGYGLGLSIVKQIVEKLEGQVGVESTPSSGSLFYFCLPAV